MTDQPARLSPAPDSVADVEGRVWERTDSVASCDCLVECLLAPTGVRVGDILVDDRHRDFFGREVLGLKMVGDPPSIVATLAHSSGIVVNFAQTRFLVPVRDPDGDVVRSADGTLCHHPGDDDDPVGELEGRPGEDARALLRESLEEAVAGGATSLPRALRGSPVGFTRASRQALEEDDPRELTEAGFDDVVETDAGEARHLLAQLVCTLAKNVGREPQGVLSDLIDDTASLWAELEPDAEPDETQWRVRIEVEAKGEAHARIVSGAMQEAAGKLDADLLDDSVEQL